MPYLNNQQLMGHLGHDAELRITPQNKTVLSFSVATSKGVKGADGNWTNITTWHKVTLWESTEHQIAGLKKGNLVYVEGETVHEEYTDKDGIKRHATKVNAKKCLVFSKEPQQGQAQEQENVYSGPVSQPEGENFNGDLPF